MLKRRYTKAIYIAIIFILVLGFTAWFRYQQHKTSVTDLIPPYYEKSVFEKPPDLPTSIQTHESNQVKNLRLPIIMYHYVEYIKDINDIIRKRLDIVPDVFDKELRTLTSTGYTSYFVRDVPKLLHGDKPFSEKSVILTFDDGYEDFYTYAFPLLKKYNAKATIYIMYNFIGRKGYLNAKEIQEIIDSGLVEIGSHTLDHAYLKNSSPVVAKKEIFDNKKRLEDYFGIEVSTFAYPYGAFTKDTLSLVKEASYSAAVSVIPGITQSEDNLYFLSRIRAGLLGGANIVRVLERYKQ